MGRRRPLAEEMSQGTTSQLGEKVEIEAKRVGFFKKNRTVFKTRRTSI
jgi:hypothetical protein